MASEYTSHYNLDKYVASDKPNLRDQYNSAMDKIDAQMFANSTAATTAQNVANNMNAVLNEEIARAKAAENDLEFALEKQISDTADDITAGYKSADSALKTELAKDIATAQATADGAVTDATNALTVAQTNATNIANETTRAKAAESALETIIKNATVTDGSITSAKLADGAITAAKIAQSAVTSILSGLTIHYFNSADSNADNTGLSVGSGCTLCGFYIEEWQMLIITTAYVNASVAVPAINDSSTSGVFTLPSYVPRPTSTFIQLTAGIGMVKETSSGDLATTGLRYANTGVIGPNSSASAGTYVYATPGVYILTPYVSNTVNASDLLASFRNDNGTL